MKMVSALLLFGFFVLDSVPVAFAGNDAAVGFEWASATEVYESSQCYQEDGEPLRGSQEFTNGCLDFIGEKPVKIDESAGEEAVATSPESESAQVDGNSAFSEEEIVPPHAENIRESNDEFIPDGLTGYSS